MPSDTSWQPSCTAAAWQHRASLLTRLRAFFAARSIMEVETPLLASAGNPDPYIHSFRVATKSLGLTKQEHFYLQTSPEFAMKRLLAAGSGSIYQICKAFRAEELGARHNPEFTMLEWYRIGFNHHDLMAEMDELLQTVAGTAPAIYFSYQEIFKHFLQIDPFIISDADLIAFAGNLEHATSIDSETLTRDDWLNLLIATEIEPRLSEFAEPVFVFNYPITQAALARIGMDAAEQAVAERFEVYINGIELANGFYELTDATMQRQRFLAENERRSLCGLVPLPIDEYLLAALEAGLPECAGVALGVDRLLMYIMGKHNIADVLSFAWDRA